MNFVRTGKSLESLFFNQWFCHNFLNLSQKQFLLFPTTTTTRYNSLLQTKWNKKKSFEDNAAAMPRGNLGRAYDSSIDLTKALENHFNPTLASERIKQTHEWLKGGDSSSSSSSDGTSSLEKEQGWKKGYNLTVWQEMPGEIDSRAIQKIILQIFTGGRLGMVGTGPGVAIKKEASQIRKILSTGVAF